MILHRIGVLPIDWCSSLRMAAFFVIPLARNRLPALIHSFWTIYVSQKYISYYLVVANIQLKSEYSLFMVSHAMSYRVDFTTSCGSMLGSDKCLSLSRYGQCLVALRLLCLLNLHPKARTQPVHASGHLACLLPNHGAWRKHASTAIKCGLRRGKKVFDTNSSSLELKVEHYWRFDG